MACFEREKAAVEEEEGRKKRGALNGEFVCSVMSSPDFDVPPFLIAFTRMLIAGNPSAQTDSVAATWADSEDAHDAYLLLRVYSAGQPLEPQGLVALPALRSAGAGGASATWDELSHWLRHITPSQAVAQASQVSLDQTAETRQDSRVDLTEDGVHEFKEVMWWLTPQPGVDVDKGHHVLKHLRDYKYFFQLLQARHGGHSSEAAMWMGVEDTGTVVGLPLADGAEEDLCGTLDSYLQKLFPSVTQVVSLEVIRLTPVAQPDGSGFLTAAVWGSTLWQEWLHEEKNSRKRGSNEVKGLVLAAGRSLSLGRVSESTHDEDGNPLEVAWPDRDLAQPHADAEKRAFEKLQNGRKGPPEELQRLVNEYLQVKQSCLPLVKRPAQLVLLVDPDTAASVGMPTVRIHNKYVQRIRHVAVRVVFGACKDAPDVVLPKTHKPALTSIMVGQGADASVEALDPPALWAYLNAQSRPDYLAQSWYSGAYCLVVLRSGSDGSAVEAWQFEHATAAAQLMSTGDHLSPLMPWLVVVVGDANLKFQSTLERLLPEARTLVHVLLLVTQPKMVAGALKEAGQVTTLRHGDRARETPVTVLDVQLVTGTQLHDAIDPLLTPTPPRPPTLPPRARPRQVHAEQMTAEPDLTPLSHALLGDYEVANLSLAARSPVAKDDQRDAEASARWLDSFCHGYDGKDLLPLPLYLAAKLKPRADVRELEAEVRRAFDTCKNRPRPLHMRVVQSMAQGGATTCLRQLAVRLTDRYWVLLLHAGDPVPPEEAMRSLLQTQRRPIVVLVDAGVLVGTDLKTLAKAFTKPLPSVVSVLVLGLERWFPSQEPLPKGHVSGFLPAILRPPCGQDALALNNNERANVAANLSALLPRSMQTDLLKTDLLKLTSSSDPVHMVEMLACASSTVPVARLRERLNNETTSTAMEMLALLSLRVHQRGVRDFRLTSQELKLAHDVLPALCDVVVVRKDAGVQYVSMRPFWAMAVLTAKGCLPGRRLAPAMLATAGETLLWCVDNDRFDLTMLMLSGTLPLWVRQFCSAGGFMDEGSKMDVATKISELVSSLSSRMSGRRKKNEEIAKTQVALWMVLSKMERQLVTYVPEDARGTVHAQIYELRSGCRAVDYSRLAKETEAVTQVGDATYARSLLHLASVVVKSAPNWEGVTADKQGTVAQKPHSWEWLSESPPDLAKQLVEEALSIFEACQNTADKKVRAVLESERSNGTRQMKRALAGTGEAFADTARLLGEGGGGEGYGKGGEGYGKGGEGYGKVGKAGKGGAQGFPGCDDFDGGGSDKSGAERDTDDDGGGTEATTAAVLHHSPRRPIAALTDDSRASRGAQARGVPKEAFVAEAKSMMECVRKYQGPRADSAARTPPEATDFAMYGEEEEDCWTPAAMCP